jgi:hypothetical protein
MVREGGPSTNFFLQYRIQPNRIRRAVLLSASAIPRWLGTKNEL